MRRPAQKALPDVAKVQPPAIENSEQTLDPKTPKRNARRSRVRKRPPPPQPPRPTPGGRKSDSKPLRPRVAKAKQPAVEKELPSPVGVLLALDVVSVVLIGIAYAIPVYIAIHSPISGLIFGFALWEAWKINRRVHLAFNGPFRLGPESTEGPGPRPRGGRP